jgi:3-dehydroquinate synthase
MGQQLGMISEDLVTRQRKLLQRFNLPIKAVGIPVDDIRLAMSLDKKVQSGTNRWVMLESVGTAVVRQDIPWDIVEDTLMHLTRE